MCGNRDQIIETSREQFLLCDQEQLIRKFHLEADEEHLYLRFLNDLYEIGRKDGFITKKGSSEKPPHDVVMTIYDLFAHRPDLTALPPLFGVWKSVADLVGGIHGAQHEKRLYNEFVFARFAGKADKLKAACIRLGGTEAADGDVSYILPVFDFFPVWIKFWDADDEFPADIRLFWDQNTDAFLNFEILFYLTAYLEDLLAEMIA